MARGGQAFRLHCTEGADFFYKVDSVVGELKAFLRALQESINASGSFCKSHAPRVHDAGGTPELPALRYFLGDPKSYRDCRER